MNSAHIHTFFPYLVLGAGLTIVVGFLAPPSATLRHSLGRVITIADVRPQNPQPIAEAAGLRNFAPQGSWFDVGALDTKKGPEDTQGSLPAPQQTAIDTHGDAKEPLSLTGQPNQTCSAWLQDWADPAKHEGQLDWILGFVTGSNYRSEGQGQPQNTDDVEIFIEHYCRNNPDHHLFMAAAALVQESGGPAALHKFKQCDDCN